MVSPESIAAANKLELARGAGQRYLIQRWEGGTLCDKTNTPRKVEVQVSFFSFSLVGFPCFPFLPLVCATQVCRPGLCVRRCRADTPFF